MDLPVTYQYVEPFNVLAMTEEIFKEKALNVVRRLAPVALSFTGNEAEAQLLLEETYFRAVANWESYKGTVPLNAWILEIMGNIHEADCGQNPLQEQVTKGYRSSGFGVSAVSRGKKGNPAGRLTAPLLHAGSYLQDILKLGFQQYYLGHICQDMADALRQSLATLKNRLYGVHKED